MQSKGLSRVFSTPQFKRLRAGSLSVAKRSYPTSEVRGSGLECQAVTAQEQPRGATPHPRSGATAGRRYPASEARGGGQEDQPHVQGVVAVPAQEGLEEPSHIEGQEGQREEIPLIQGKEQWLCFAVVAMKRYPTPKVRETQVNGRCCKRASEGRHTEIILTEI